MEVFTERQRKKDLLQFKHKLPASYALLISFLFFTTFHTYMIKN